jgi:hypothetical protein
MPRCEAVFLMLNNNIVFPCGWQLAGNFLRQLRSEVQPS